MLKSMCPIDFSAEDLSAVTDYLVQGVRRAAQQAGASVLNIPDTVGYATPARNGELIPLCKSPFKSIRIRMFLSVHCHNDLRMGVLIAWPVCRAVRIQIECTVNGIGERAAISALEEIVMAIKSRADTYGCETGPDTRQIYRTSKLLSTVTGACRYRRIRRLSAQSRLLTGQASISMGSSITG